VPFHLLEARVEALWAPLCDPGIDPGAVGLVELAVLPDKSPLPLWETQVAWAVGVARYPRKLFVERALEGLAEAALEAHLAKTPHRSANPNPCRSLVLVGIGCPKFHRPDREGRQLQ